MKSNFKLIVTIVFIAIAVLAVMVFAGAIKIGGDTAKSDLTGKVTFWGTVPKEDVSDLLNDFSKINNTFTINYVAKSPTTYNQDLLEAFAAGKGPDLFLVTEDSIYNNYDKAYTIPFATYPLLNFQSYNAPAADVFLTGQGSTAFPLAIDPLIMYYNRNMLDANNILYPPEYWDELNEEVVKITKKSPGNQITQSAVALGQFTNVNNAKDILTTMFMQVGNPVVNKQGSSFQSGLIDPRNSKPPSDALLFYTSFASPSSSTYSWNKTLANSQDAFTSNSLAFYFGFASELSTLINKNPNLNFGIAPLPQVKNSKTKVTGARVVGISVSAFSRNFNTAYGAASLLTSGDFAREYARIQGIAPIRRDLLAERQKDVYSPVFYSTALIARTWVDPSPKETDNIFRSMVESVFSSSLKPKAAIIDAGERINLLLR